MKKIISNLFLGSFWAIPKKKDEFLVISCAREIFEANAVDNQKNKISNDNFYFWKEPNLIYFNFENDFYNNYLKNVKKLDYEIKKLKEIIKLIINNINYRKVYIHCLAGINRSPSIVFIILVLKNILIKKSFSENLNLFKKKFYPDFSPSVGWIYLLKVLFPYKIFL